MPHLLIIDDDGACRASVRRAAAPLGCDILEANDGLAGLEIARRYTANLDLVVLDVHMPQLDGYWTCLRLRELRPARPLAILPFTGVADAIPFLTELGCLPPILKPATLAQLQQALGSALTGAGAPLPPASAVVQFAQHHAAHVEQAARERSAHERVVLYASAQVVRLGLRQLLAAAGTTTIIEAASAAALVQVLAATEPAALVAPASEAHIVQPLAEQQQLPLLLVASSIAEGLLVANLTASVPVGVAIADDDGAAMAISAAMAELGCGHQHIPGRLRQPFAGSGLTPREQTVLVLDMQALPVDAIAARLGVAEETIHRYHSRLYQKLGLRSLAELRQWASDWLARR